MTLRLLFDLRVYPLHSNQVCDCCLFFIVVLLVKRSQQRLLQSRLPYLAVQYVPVGDYVSLVLVLGCAGQDPSASTAAGGPSGEGAGGGGGGSLGDRVARYGRVLLITAVVAFKIVEWWNRVESQVRGWTGHG